MRQRKDTDFFNLTRFIKDNELTQFADPKQSDLLCINGPRNIGKSTAVYRYLLKNKFFTADKKVLILRNTEEQVKMMRGDFNNRFPGRLICISNFIYSLELREYKTGRKTDTRFEKGELVGYIAAISTYLKVKSMEAKNVKFIFYEEYNEDMEGKNIYPKFIDLITTFMRFNVVKLLMVGNRNSYLNDYMVSWDIQPAISYEETKQFDILFPTPKGEEKVGNFFELGMNDFEGLGNRDQLYWKLAQCDNRTKQFLDGKYMNDFDRMVISHKKIIPTFYPTHNIVIDEKIYCLGNFTLDYNQYYAILSYYNYSATGIPNISLDKISNAMFITQATDKAEQDEVLTFLFSRHKKALIYYDSFDLLFIIKQIFKTLTLDN